MRIVQGWGMTETSPLAAVAHPPASVEHRRRPRRWTGGRRPGRVVAGVELRIVDDQGNPLPWDGEAVGEIEVRGPWITGVLLPRRRRPRSSTTAGCAPATSARSTRKGFIQITDRAKDVIKSGGEWISSVELENHLMAHPDVDRGERHRRARPALGGAAARVRGRARTGAIVDAADARGVPRRARREVAGAGAVGVHRRGAEDQRRQVRQEGAARPPREGRPRRRTRWIEERRNAE